MPPALQAAKDVAPEVPRALLLENLWDGWERVAEALGCIAVVTHHPLMDGALVQRLHQMGCRAVCYTVNAPDVADRLWDAGVDALITDAVDRFSPGP
jgi:glycerophosphoryl diester phosphodiesterase